MLRALGVLASSVVLTTGMVVPMKSLNGVLSFADAGARPKKEAEAAEVTESSSMVVNGYSVGKGGDVRVLESEYERIDEKMFKLSKFQRFIKDHALHETLKGEKKVEQYEIYRKKGADEIMAIVRFGQSLNGHPEIVHGGITSLVFDNSFGWLFFCLNKPMAVTANLNINYRKPLKQNTTTILRAKMSKEEGRKMFMDATLHEASANGKESLIADSSTLFIKMKLPFWKQLYVKVFG